jgi:hypothetical protein
MRNRNVVGAAATLAAVLVVALVAAFLIGDEDSEGPDLPAAEVLPADADVVHYLDRSEAAEQVGAETDEGSAGQADAYLAAVQEASWVATPLVTYLALAEDAPFSELDVDWWASVQVGDVVLDVYRTDDDLDLGTVADDLAAAGLDESELGGHRRFKVGPDAPMDDSGLIDGLPARELLDVTVLEDDHLLVAGSEPERVVDVVSDDADSLADTDELGQLTAMLDATPLYATAYVGSEALCGEQGFLETTSPEVRERLLSDLGDLGSPAARGLFVVPDGDGVRAEAVLAFGSDDEAAADAQARDAWLVEGIDPVTNRRNGDLLDVRGVEADGSAVVVDAGSDAALALQVGDSGFGPLACAG